MKKSGVVKPLLILGVLLATAIAGSHFLQLKSTVLDWQSDAANSDIFVTRNSTKFFIGTEPFAFVGFNLFDAAGASGPYSCVAQNGWFPKFTPTELDQIMSQMKTDAGATVLRFWAFQKYTNGATDFSGIDAVISTARKNGLRVIPVLEDGQGYCTEPGGGGNGHIQKWQYQGDTWYTNGYKTVNSGYKISYRDYVAKIVDRYKNEPTILGWMMMNEADTSLKVNGKSPLVGFATDIGSLIKSIDSNHLVTVGTQSNGASGATGQDFIDVYGLPSVDFAEAHDWGYWGSDTQAIPGGVQNADGSWSLPNPTSAECLKTYQAKIGCSFAQATQILHKPIIVGESGIAATDAAGRTRRANLINQKMSAFFANGGAGYLYWQWNHVLDSEHFDVLGNTNDPLLPTMKKYSGLSDSAQPTPSLLPSATVTTTPLETPKPSVTPTTKPTVAPTVKPTATASPKPTPTPFTPPTTGTLEGEVLLNTGSTTIITDQTASGGKALVMKTNGTASGEIQGVIQKLIIRTKAQPCLGYPHINIKIDGKYVLDSNIQSTTFTNYQTNSLSYLQFTNTKHKVEIIYNNDASFGFCDRNLVVDSVSIQ